MALARRPPSLHARKEKIMALTPDAGPYTVAPEGLLALLAGARTTPTQPLEALLGGEPSGSEAWSVLVSLAAVMGQDELAAEFREAMLQEEEHRARVRAW